VLAHQSRSTPDAAHLRKIYARLTLTRSAGPQAQEVIVPVPQLDLADHEIPGFTGEWGIGCPRAWIGAGYPVGASAFPGRRDRSVVQIHRGFRRDEIPRLIAFLGAVYAEAWPDEEPGAAQQ
jgi:hypothetical protein